MFDNPMDTYPWFPALRLRQVRQVEHLGGSVYSERPPKLQQLWRHATSGETQWRDVPIVDEDAS